MRAMNMRHGFTLIELMIALAIFGILLMLAGPQLAQFLASSQVRNAAESIYNGVQRTQTTAIAGNASTRFLLDPTTGTGGWQILETIDGAESSPPNPIQVYSLADGAKDVSIVSTPGGTTQVTFDGFGRMQCNADDSANLQWVDVTSSNLFARALRVCITDRQVAGCPGSVPVVASQFKVCDPNAPSTNTQVACPASCQP